jgi:hypothetical protein
MHAFSMAIRVGPGAGNYSLHANLRPDQANTEPWKNRWVNLDNPPLESFVPSSPKSHGFRGRSSGAKLPKSLFPVNYEAVSGLKHFAKHRVPIHFLEGCLRAFGHRGLQSPKPALRLTNGRYARAGGD